MIALQDVNGLLTEEEAARIRAAAQAAMNEEHKRGHVEIIAVTEAEMREINRMQRNIDRVTDVLSFPMAEPGQPPPDGYFGDILICPARAREQAAEYGHGGRREFAFLTIHGMLHLFGYDHAVPAEEERMIKKQRKILERMDEQP